MVLSCSLYQSYLYERRKISGNEYLYGHSNEPYRQELESVMISSSHSPELNTTCADTTGEKPLPSKYFLPLLMLQSHLKGSTDDTYGPYWETKISLKVMLQALSAENLTCAVEQTGLLGCYEPCLVIPLTADTDLYIPGSIRFLPI